ncbi:hypothetical protein METUNv1_03245 [Methyloversatilis universalis FAM5]|uniref:Uncharacterized protein n=1 Tax=Methyloversatilis universalis (strain ATCC BAA-1314 / DSM 25237 / JCM 13912 / CCUG 52030 / FAM5) TaxID=1000565 RepID=F5RGE8_METUF|nr:hypothetical protein METUNv1_03245 [Methyloversatilis universalis FAM5]
MDGHFIAGPQTRLWNGASAGAHSGRMDGQQADWRARHPVGMMPDGHIILRDLPRCKWFHLTRPGDRPEMTDYISTGTALCQMRRSRRPAA